MTTRFALELEDFGPFTVGIDYDVKNGWKPKSAFFIDRGKPGHDLDEILYRVGIKVSKAIQGR